MHVTLVCVGGPCDGRRVSVVKTCSTVRLIAPKKPLAAPRVGNEEFIPVEYAVYYKEVIACNNERMYYFRYAGTKPEETIKQLIEGYKTVCIEG